MSARDSIARHLVSQPQPVYCFIQVANWAVKAGFQPGQTVALFMENRPEYIVTWLGLTKAGITIALINSNNKKKPLVHSIDIAHCVSIIFGSEVSENVAGVLPELQAKGISLFEFPEEDAPASDFAVNMRVEVREDLSDSQNP